MLGHSYNSQSDSVVLMLLNEKQNILHGKKHRYIGLPLLMHFENMRTLSSNENDSPKNLHVIHLHC